VGVSCTLLTASLSLKRSNSDALDVFGQFEFHIEKHQLALSGATLRYGVTAAEISFSILHGVSIRESWFKDQSVGQTVEAAISETADSELEKTQGSSSSIGVSGKALTAGDASSSARRTKSGSKVEIQYKTKLVNVRAVGTSQAPAWHVLPPVRNDYLAGHIPAQGTRLMQVKASSKLTAVEINTSAIIEYAAVSLSGKKLSANALIMAEAMWHKHFRAKRRSIQFEPITAKSI